MVIHFVGDVSSSVNHLSVSFCFNLFRPGCCSSELFIPLVVIVLIIALICLFVLVADSRPRKH